jgi:hypothetical protein
MAIVSLCLNLYDMWVRLNTARKENNRALSSSYVRLSGSHSFLSPSPTHLGHPTAAATQPCRHLLHSIGGGHLFSRAAPWCSVDWRPLDAARARGGTVWHAARVSALRRVLPRDRHPRRQAQLAQVWVEADQGVPVPAWVLPVQHREGVPDEEAHCVRRRGRSLSPMRATTATMQRQRKAQSSSTDN